MRAASSERAIWAAALILVAIAAAWVVFAPTQFGGQASYVIINGNSMEPLYHRGDLVILREAAEYAVGDIVTYRHPDIGPVIHRIIGRDGLRFMVKGDNNDWTDSYAPVRADLVGAAWLHLPMAGGFVEWVRRPASLAGAAGLMGILIVATVTDGAKSRRPGRRSRTLGAKVSSPMSRFRVGSREDWLFILGALAFAGLLLGGAAFTRALTRTVEDEISYQHQGLFSYTGPAPADLYDFNTLQTGEPAFGSLTNDLHFKFDYTLAADVPMQVKGSYRLVAEVRDATGWKRTFEMQPETAFAGSRFTAEGDLPLPRMRALIALLKERTGLIREAFTVAVVPQVSLQGQVGPEELQDYFAPRLEFQLTDVVLQMVQPDPSLPDPRLPRQSGLLKHARVEPNTLSLLSLTLTVLTARWLAVIGLLASAGGLAALAHFDARRAQGGEAARVQAKYGALLVSVRSAGLRARERVVDTASIDDLAKVAEKDARPILHEQDGHTHRYVVRDTAGGVYRYQIIDTRETKGGRA